MLPVNTKSYISWSKATTNVLLIVEGGNIEGLIFPSKPKLGTP